MIQLRILTILFFQVAEAEDDRNTKRFKPNEGSVSENDSVKTGEEDEKQTKANQKPPEPPKDYIHVRARRGQATDSHSLAERVRITAQFSHHSLQFFHGKLSINVAIFGYMGWFKGRRSVKE